MLLAIQCFQHITRTPTDQYEFKMLLNVGGLKSINVFVSVFIPASVLFQCVFSIVARAR